MAVPKYSGRLLDKLILIVAGQTGSVKENPDELAYPDKRASVLKATTWAMWRVRNEMHALLRAEEADAKKLPTG